MPGEFWPDALIDSIARRDFVLFVGSGVSSSCTNGAGNRPPTWPDLLHEAAEVLVSNAAKRRVRKRAKADLLDAAELLFHEAYGTGRVADLRSLIARLVDGESADQFQPSAWHEELMRLDPLTILTTNYDRIVERAGGFGVVRPEDNNLARELRLGKPLILKVHGTVENEENMVFTQSDYVRLRRECSTMLDTVGALFLTRTCLFVGYSITDPDIRLLLEAVARPGTKEVAHYLLSPKVTIENQHTVDAFRRNFGVELLEYPRSPDHAEGLTRLSMLAELVEEKRTNVPV